MVEIFLKILPFFLLIGCGYGAAATRFFSAEATAYLTKFVFYFALSAMLFRFSSQLDVKELFDAQFAAAYLLGCFAVYFVYLLVAHLRKTGLAEAAIEAQCSVIGNNGFLAVPMLIALIGERAVGPTLFVLAMDQILFGALVVVLITTAKEGGLSLRSLGRVGLGIVKNPMVMSMLAGVIWSTMDWSVAPPILDFLTILGSAATPCALFAIGASLAGKSAERPGVAIWLSFGKLVLHPLSVAFFALIVFPLDPFAAGIMIITAAMPVAGNIFIIAQHYGVAPTRVSSSILISTVGSVITLSLVLGWVLGN